MKPDPEPTSVTETPNVSNQDQTHMHAWQKLHMLMYQLLDLPQSVAHQCITLSKQSQTC